MKIENNSTDNAAEDEFQEQRAIDDACPDWAVTMIDQLRQIEIILGNVPKAIEWKSSLLKNVNKKVFAENEGPISEYHAELMFTKIVKGLVEEQFSISEISTFINVRIGYKGGPKYCNENEVSRALG